MHGNYLIMTLTACVHFRHQEMAQHQKRLIPCLLGVTRESIIKVDSNTKAVIKTWPLSIVRRWGSSPNIFTLVIIVLNHWLSTSTIITCSSFYLSPKDFGEYTESTYSVQTSDGEAISRLIAGYVDIITAQKSPAAPSEVVTDDLIMNQHAG